MIDLWIQSFSGSINISIWFKAGKISISFICYILSEKSTLGKQSQACTKMYYEDNQAAVFVSTFGYNFVRGLLKFNNIFSLGKITFLIETSWNLEYMKRHRSP